MKTQINLKIDSRIKKDAQRMAKELGLSLSSVVNVTLKQFARTGELEISATPKMSSYLENLIKEAHGEFEAGKSHGPFGAADEMIKSLES